MFHAVDELFFERLADGSVRVKAPGLEQIVPSDIWASVVASVSLRGENIDRWNEARNFHGESR